MAGTKDTKKSAEKAAPKKIAPKKVVAPKAISKQEEVVPQVITPQVVAPKVVAAKVAVAPKVAPKKAARKPKAPNVAPIAHAVGRRKKAVARAWLRPGGSGQVRVNGISSDTYFDTSIMRLQVAMPFTVCPVGTNYDIQINVNGGGKRGQAGAVKLAIARAFLDQDETLRPVLRQAGLLTVDSRVKERKKYGQKGGAPVWGWIDREVAGGRKREEVVGGVTSDISLGIIPPEDDCARGVLFLVSDYSKAVSGAVLDINGGQYMAP